MAIAAHEVVLAVRVGGLTLPNPVMIASGCGGSGAELARFLDISTLGAFVTRSITVRPQLGDQFEGPRWVETPGALLSNMRGQNAGLQGFLATELPPLAAAGVRTVVSIAGGTAAELSELARRCGASPGVSAVEVNLSVRQGDGSGPFFDEDPYAAAKVINTVRRDLPRGVALFAKVTPSGPFVDLVRHLAREQIDALVIGHGPRGLNLDAHTLKPVLVGSVTGPAIAPLARHAVWQARQLEPGTPIVAAGGISSGADALAMLALGASAFQIGTATLREPLAPARIAAELQALLAGRGQSADDVIGLAHGVSHPEAAVADALEPR